MPEAVLEYVQPGAELIVGLANGEPKHVVDKVVTEYGIAELRGQPIRERARRRRRICRSAPRGI